MGWFNRFCIHQLLKANQIAEARLDFARKHGSIGEAELRAARLAEIKARITLRCERESRQEYRRQNRYRPPPWNIRSGPNVFTTWLVTGRDIREDRR